MFHLSLYLSDHSSNDHIYICNQWQGKRQINYANVIPKPERKQFKAIEQTLRTGVWIKV